MVSSKKLMVLVTVLVLTACSRQAPAPEPVRAVRVMSVGQGAGGSQVEYAGEVRARTESRLGFRVGGKVVQREVNLGDSVKPGQVLARLDPRDLRLGEDAARAALSAAIANRDQAEADYKRYKDLRDQGFISSAELERRDTALKAARAQYDQAKAQSSAQGNQAGYAALTADAAGVITGVEAEPGMVVAPGATVVRLAQDGPRDVVFAVPEDKVGVLKAVSAEPGRVKVRLWGASGEPLPARVREIASAADPVTRTFLVKAEVAAQAEMRLGQTATVLLDLPGATGATRLPLSALKEEKGQTVVWLLDRSAMTVRTQPVKVAGVQGNEVLVSSGVQPGQSVVTAGVHVLTPGQKVRLWVDPTAPASPPEGRAGAAAAAQ